MKKFAQCIQINLFAYCFGLMSLIPYFTFGQSCPLNSGSYTNSYAIETGQDHLSQGLPYGTSDTRWQMKYEYANGDNPVYGTPTIVSVFGSSLRWLEVPRNGGGNKKVTKSLKTTFCFSSCNAFRTMTMRGRVREATNFIIRINGVQVFQEDQIEFDALDYNISNTSIDPYLHAGTNVIELIWDDLFVNPVDNTSKVFFRADISSSLPVFCCYDQNYITSVLDSDGDGVKDYDDAFDCNAGESIDCDGDGLGDNSDLDDDNDGFPDLSDDFDCNPDEWIDTDKDGIGDNEDPVLSDCCKTFQPDPGAKYWLSAWVKEDLINNQAVKSYWKPYIELEFTGGAQPVLVQFYPSGELIDGWQRIVGEFVIPQNCTDMDINLINRSSNDFGQGGSDVYFDDIRIHPFNAGMKSYVYDPETFWLTAELDDNNYATFYEYDNEGQLIRIKKETARGIMTIQESRSNNPKVVLGPVVGNPNTTGQ